MAIIKRDIELRNGQVTINLDDDALVILIKECVNAISKTHPSFTFIANLTDITIYGSRIHVLMVNELIKEPNLEVDIYWSELGYIYPFEYMELSNTVFPNNLKNEAKLNIQKHITRKIWEEYKYQK